MPETLIRPVRREEVWQILTWRNAPRVRQAMLTNHEISRTEHEVWFKRKMADPLFRQLTSEHNGKPVSIQAFFNIKPGCSAWWAFYFTDAVPDDMTAMMRIWKGVELAGLTYAFEVLQLETLYCEVLRSNYGVYQWHKRFGFVSCDPAISANTRSFDLEVLSLSRNAFERLKSGRSGIEIKAIEICNHPFDTIHTSKEPGQ